MVPGPKGRARPMPLRVLRQGPGPPLNRITQSKRIESDEQLPKSPEIVDIDLGTGDRNNAPSRQSTKENRRNTRTSERSIDILQYYFRTPTPNALASAFQNNEPSDNAIAAFEFGLYDLNPNKAQTASKSSAEGRKHKAKVSSQDKALPPVPQSPNSQQRQPQAKTPTHQKTYSLFPATASRPSLDQQPARLVPESPITGPTTRKSREGHLPLQSRTRADSTAALLPAATLTICPNTSTTTETLNTTTTPRPPRRPLNVRIRSSASTSSTSSPPSSAHASRWSGDTMTSSLCSPVAKISFSSTSPIYDRSTSYLTNKNPGRPASGSISNTTVRDSLEPCAWAASQQVCSVFEDDDDEDETVPLRRKWKEGWKRSKGSLQWSPGSSCRSSADSGGGVHGGLVKGRKVGGGGAGSDWWAKVGKLMLCGCVGVRK